MRDRDLASTFALALALLGSPTPANAEPLTGTKPLDMQGDLALQMVAGIDRFLLREIDRSVERRGRYWHRDPSSPASYEKSLAANREHLKRAVGALDPRDKCEAIELVGTTAQPALVGRGEGFEVYAVRWPVLRGVTGEGLLLKPTTGKVVADVIAIPDADQSPEMLVGLLPGVPAESQFARRLAESGCRVLVPMLVDRADTWSLTVAAERSLNQPHREFIYRQAYEMGRHVIGYELQKILTALDWLSAEARPKDPNVGLIGYGEGGLLALYAAAVDPRVDVTCVSGYFDSRQRLWQEPIYRNVFRLLDEFGDAELASLIAPRTLLVEACRVPDVSGPPPLRQGRTGGAAPGRLTTPPPSALQAELERTRRWVRGLKPQPRLELLAAGDGTGPFGSPATLASFLDALAPAAKLAPLADPPTHSRHRFDAAERMKRQVDELTDYTQSLVRESEYTRRTFWAKADRKSRSVDKWKQTTDSYRRYFHDEVIGRFDQPRLAPNVRTRKVYDEPKYAGYEVVMDVFPEVFGYGLLLVPKDIKPGERRPVVVCQHGLEGRPQDVATPRSDNPYYHGFAWRLAERGFITYSPQNPYIFEDRFRTLQRKLNPLGKTLFSIIVPQHQQAVDWLAQLPIVDPERIAFYGLSYGGKTAMRVPALVERYCLSICSADFNEWIWKNTSTRSPYSYLNGGEYEMFEFDLGNTFNYAEMAALIAPRPFMVERGHRDGVAPDEWVAYEYARVRLLYTDLKIPDRTRIDFFDGPHTIHGMGTFDFLAEHLNWPPRRR